MKGVEKISFEAAEDVLQEFIYKFQVFSHENGVHKECRKEIIELQITTSALVEEMDKPWNQDRLESSINDQFKAPSSAPSKTLKDAQVPCSQVESEMYSSSKKSEKRSLELTPETKQIKFARISPKSDLMEQFQCTHCSKKYLWLKALSRHMRDAHNETVPKHMKENKHKITCRICNSRVSQDLVTRHLKRVHGIEKSSSSRALFRGFITFNESSWIPLWLENGEPDPPTEMMVPIQNGKITMYGNVYEVEESSVHERNNPDDEAKNEVAPDYSSAELENILVVLNTKESLTSQKEGTSKLEEEAMNIEIDNMESISVDQNSKKKVTSQKEVALVDMEKALEDLNFPGTPIHRNETSLFQVNQNSCFRRSLDFYALQDEFHDDENIDLTKAKEDGSGREIIDKPGDEDLNKSAVELGEEENVEYDVEMVTREKVDNGMAMGTRLEGNNEVARMMRKQVDIDVAMVIREEGDNEVSRITRVEDDEVSRIMREEDDNEVSRMMRKEVDSDGAKKGDVEKVKDCVIMTGEEEVDEETGKAAEGYSTARKLHKLKVEVFLVETTNGEFWSSSEAEWDVDSDFDEDTDDKEYTEGRMEMKKLRFDLTLKYYSLFIKTLHYISGRREGIEQCWSPTFVSWKATLKLSHNLKHFSGVPNLKPAAVTRTCLLSAK